MTERNRIELKVGEAKSDGEFLVHGFGVVKTLGARQCRGVNLKARMVVPGFRGVDNVMTLELQAKPPNRLKLIAGDTYLGDVAFQTPEWGNFTFTVPAKAVGAAGAFVLSFEFDRFDPAEHWSPSCGHLARVAVEAEGGVAPAAREAVSVPAYNIYFGDPHVHSDLSFCDKPYSGSPQENYEYARDEAKLDFVALADHAEHMTDEIWREASKIRDGYNQDGSFVTIPTFEWSSEMFGHRNVYYRESGGAIFGSLHPETNTPRKLWRALREQGMAAITPQHHPSRIEFTGAWRDYDPEFVPVGEIYSKWGASEHYGNPRQEKQKTVVGCFVQDALARGQRLGFIGGSDGHVLMPGSRGLTAVLAESLDRGAVFDAIKQRLCYATTGARIGMDFRLNGHMMGRELTLTPYQAEALYPMILYVSVAPTAPLEKVELIESNQVIYTYTFVTGGGHPGYHSKLLEPLSKKNGLERISFTHIIDPPHKTWVKFTVDDVSQPRRLPTWDRYFYVRVSQADGHMAWSSPVWLTVVPREDEA